MPTLDARFERHRSRENWRIPSINFDYVTCFNAENEHRALAWKSSRKVTRFTKYRELPLHFGSIMRDYSKLQSLSLRFFNAAIGIFDNKGFRTIKGIGNKEQEFQPKLKLSIPQWFLIGWNSYSLFFVPFCAEFLIISGSSSSSRLLYRFLIF